MNSSEKEDVIFAVKRLAERVRRGDVRFTDNVPQTVSELEAVRFDRAGEPIYETIGPLVRAMGLGMIVHDSGTEAEERRCASPVHQFLGEPVAVTEMWLSAVVG